MTNTLPASLSFDQALAIVQGHLELYRAEREAIERMIGLVQENPEFFGVRLGDSCLKAAADKLERLVFEEAAR